MELRRLKMLNKNDPDAFIAWCDKHKLGRKELMVILCSVSLDPSVVGSGGEFLPKYLRGQIDYSKLE